MTGHAYTVISFGLFRMGRIQTTEVVVTQVHVAIETRKIH